VNGRADNDNGGRSNDAMIFDTENPTGISDLDFGGRGKVIILSEDGNEDEPDDSETGGTFFFHFDGFAQIESFILLDVEPDEIGRVTLFNPENTVVYDEEISGNGANSEKVINLESTTNVHTMIVRLSGSGAIDDIRYKVSCDE